MAELKAVFLNTSLKSTDEPSNTESLMQEVQSIYKEKGVGSEILRLADYNIALGVEEDMGNGDEWPKIFAKVMASGYCYYWNPFMAR